MADVNVAINIAAKTSGAVGPIGSLKAALGGLRDTAQQGFSGLQNIAVLAGGAALAGVGALAAGVTGLVVSAAGAADEMVELADKTGLTTTQIQEFKYIGEQTGTSVETVTGSLAKLTRNMASARGGTGATAEAFQALGINVVDSNGQLRDSQTVFGEALDALGKMTNETERDALAMALFGKSAQELNPLIKAGSEGIAAMSQDARDLGAVMSEEAVSGLAELNDMIAGLKLGFMGWAGTLASGFVPIFREVIGSVQEFMASPAVQTGIADFMAGVKSFAEGAADGLGQVANYIIHLANVVQEGGFSRLFVVFEDGSSYVGGFLETLGLGEATAYRIGNAVANLVTQMGTLIGQAQTAVSPIINFVTQFVSWKDALIALGVVVASIVLPALYGVVAAAAPVVLVGAALVGAIAMVRQVWENDWLGIRSAVAGAITFLQPYFDQVMVVLDAFGVAVLPPLQLAWQTLVGVWQTEVGPALGELWASLQELFAELGFGTGETDVWGVALAILIGFLRGVIDVVHLLTPAIRVLADAITFSVGMTRSMVEGLTSMQRAANSVIGPIRDLASQIGELIDQAWGMPDWLIPGSPTPFEVGLRGIGAAARALPEMNFNIGGSALTPGPSPAGRGGALAGASAGASITFAPGSIVINAPGGDPGAVQQAATDGMLAAFRAVGLR